MGAKEESEGTHYRKGTRRPVNQMVANAVSELEIAGLSLSLPLSLCVCARARVCVCVCVHLTWRSQAGAHYRERRVDLWRKQCTRNHCGMRERPFASTNGPAARIVRLLEQRPTIPATLYYSHSQPHGRRTVLHEPVSVAVLYAEMQIDCRLH